MMDARLIDTHTHILPGVDDGSRSIYESLEMAQIAADSGIAVVVATPHCNLPGYYDNYYDHHYVEVFRKTKKAIEAEGIPLKLLPGAEAFATDDLPELVREGRIMTLNKSRYLLLEFAFTEDPDYATQMLERIREIGVIPMVAHVERYEFVQDRPQIIYEWRKKGYVIQVNRGSFLGKFGDMEQAVSHLLMDHNLISVIASDAHRSNRRTPFMLDVYEELSEMYDPKTVDILMNYNPARICNSKPIVKLEPIPIEE